MIPVVLSGGVGSRLWPLSRSKHPKQLLSLIDNGGTDDEKVDRFSMLQQTLLRVQAGDSAEPPIVVCNEEHRFMVGEQLQELRLSGATIILEPEGRNTAPAIALAALQAKPDSVLLVMPADHVIQNIDAFQRAISHALPIAERGKLVTFGIVPDSPETGYGYIKGGDRDGESQDQGVSYKVEEFKEKPDAVTAAEYVTSGHYFWNGGIFVFQASVYLAELKKHAPNVFAACYAAMQGKAIDLDFVRVDEEAFARSPDISIDYAVMENTELASVVPLDVGWSDVGSWSALWEVSSKDENGNTLTGDVLLHDTHNSHIISESKLVATVGIDNMIVVETADAVLVADKSQTQDVKEIVNQLKAQNRSQIIHHRKVYRPWGWYDSIDSGERFQVKRIQVKPGASLSVQMHYHRAEHWVVVKGTAEVTHGDQVILLRENESTFIPIGTTHSLRNPSESQPLEIIEVQSGSYLGEDDIVRFEDSYGRAGTTK